MIYLQEKLGFAELSFGYHQLVIFSTQNVKIIMKQKPNNVYVQWKMKRKSYSIGTEKNPKTQFLKSTTA